jgi:hypothetical protein
LLAKPDPFPLSPTARTRRKSVVAITVPTPTRRQVERRARGHASCRVDGLEAWGRGRGRRLVRGASAIGISRPSAWLA